MILARLKKQLQADYAPEPDPERIARLTKSFTALIDSHPFDAPKSIAETVDFYQGLAEFWQGMYLLSNPQTEERVKRYLNG